MPEPSALPLTNANPPSYGAQHRQDALWQGGNEALPPLWWKSNMPNGETRYQDDTLMMVSWNRPLPGVRLDNPGDLVPGCEWQISPLGRSYFVDHNTRTTSWKKLAPERPAGSLTPECIIEGHSMCIWSLACLGTSCNITSTSEDGSIRQWTRDGETVGKPWDSHGVGVNLRATSPDHTMVISASADARLRLWSIKEDRLLGDPWVGHNAAVRCIDWSPNAVEIASGSQDGTIRRWKPATGREISPPVETNHGWVVAVRYSPQADRLASCGMDEVIRVWSNVSKLLIEIKGHESAVTSLCWSKDGAYIFSASWDCTVRQWQSIDGKELAVLRGHTNAVRSLCLSPNESHIVSASKDYSVRIWDLKTSQLVGEPLLHDDELFAVVTSPDGQYIASAGLDAKIYVWNVDAALKRQDGNPVGDAKTNAKFKRGPARPRNTFDVPLVSNQHTNNRGLTTYGNDFWGDNTSRTPRRSAPLAGRSSSLDLRHLFGFFHFSNRPGRPSNAPQPTPLKPRYWNFNLPSMRISMHPVNVAPARDDDRYAITPPSAAEVAAAMQGTSGGKTDSSTQAAEGAQGFEVPAVQGRPIQTTQEHYSAAAAEEQPDNVIVGCCGFYLVRRRPTAH